MGKLSKIFREDIQINGETKLLWFLISPSKVTSLGKDKSNFSKSKK